MPGLPDDIESIMMRALGREPDERYATAESMHREVVEVMLRRYGHTQARDLGAFVRKLFEDEHRQDLARIERAMQIQAMPERVPAHEPSGLERTAMVSLADIAPLGDDSTAPEATRFATILSSGAVVPREYTAKPSAMEVLSSTTQVTLGGGAAPLPNNEVTDVDDGVGDGTGDQTAIVRSSSLTSLISERSVTPTDDDDFEDDGATAIVRPNGPHAAFRVPAAAADDDDYTMRIDRSAAAAVIEAEPPFEPTLVVRVDDLDGAPRDNTDRRQNPVDENTDRRRQDTTGPALRAGAVASGVAPDEMADESTDRVLRRSSGQIDAVKAREVTEVGRGAVPTPTHRLLHPGAAKTREARGRQGVSKVWWFLLATAALVVAALIGYLFVMRHPVGKAVVRPGAIGSLVIVSQPLGAEVLIDGGVVGTTPFSSPSVAVGKHEVVIRDLHGRERRLTVDVKEREVTSREVGSGALKRKTG